MTNHIVGAALLVLAVGGGCGPRSVPLVARVPRHATPKPGNNWPLPPAEAEALFATEPMTLVAAEHTAQGVAGAFKATAMFGRGGRRVEIKWKPVSAGNLDDWNNNPRKEIAAYLIQRWFLTPRDYVVPTTAMRCLPLADYRRLDPTATPSIDGTSCVLGGLSLWMTHVTVPDVLLDSERFAADAHYASHLADFNLLAYLVEHRDGRPGNILVADDPTDRRVFAVDNGISFGGLVYNFLTTNWDVLRVPALRREAVARLRAVDRRALDTLRTVAELHADRKGVLQPVTPSAVIDPARGVRSQNGRLQMGLTTAEIDAVAQRIAALLDRVDRGELPVF